MFVGCLVALVLGLPFQGRASTDRVKRCNISEVARTAAKEGEVVKEDLPVFEEDDNLKLL